MAWWREVAATVAEEFSDLPDAAGWTRITLRLFMAAGLGGALGYQREQVGKAAGMRTHMLVALGSALFVVVPQQAGVSPDDLTRVLQGLVTGIGFLGAGSIIKGGDEAHVKGLTTAAGVWLTAAIGVAAGLGREVTAVFSTALALLILAALPLITGPWGKPPKAGGGGPGGPVSL